MQVQVSLILDRSATATLTQMEEQIQLQGHHWMREAMKSAIRNWESQHQRCPACRSRQVRLEGTVPRVLLTQFGRLRLALRRMRCQDCLHRWCPARQLLTDLDPFL
jgi:DNA-directed RNA polymerase subunit RPC12/RpoP